jgi:hypothetical protein
MTNCAAILDVLPLYPYPENQAMVSYMQRVGIIGSFVTVHVSAVDKVAPQSPWAIWSRYSGPYLAFPLLTVAKMWACIRLGDW